MSWGERSCTKFGKGCEIASMKTCNVDCIDYESNGAEPDSESKFKKIKPPEKPPEQSPLQAKGIGIFRSSLPKFSKKIEFVVLKGHIFNIQSVSPKKIILKFKAMTNKKDPLPDGIFCFRDQDNEQKIKTIHEVNVKNQQKEV